jgi:hypothetical protein
LSTTNPKWTDPNPGIRAKRPATNRLSHDTALNELIMSVRIFVVLQSQSMRLLISEP